jgi:3-hydroxybutyryl-CoA dehydrogenase
MWPVMEDGATAFQLRDRQIRQVGIVGAGHVGSDLALAFARGLLGFQTVITLQDVSEDALSHAREQVERQVALQERDGRLTSAQARKLLASVHYTRELEPLKLANILIEAITEDPQLKIDLYKRLESICREDALLLSCSAHLQPEVIFAGLRQPRRALVARFGYPSEVHPAVELVPGPETSGLVMSFVELLLELIGKAPVVVASRYGHALAPVVEALLLAGCLAVERGWATPKQIDQVCRRALGAVIGPFELMNATGGAEAAGVALTEYQRFIMPWYHPSRLLQEQLRSGRPWRTLEPDETVELPPALYERLASWMVGAYFAAVSELVDAQLVDLSALDEALDLGLGLTPAFGLMNQMGLGAALRLVEHFASRIRA